MLYFKRFFTILFQVEYSANVWSFPRNSEVKTLIWKRYVTQFTFEVVYLQNLLVRSDIIDFNGTIFESSQKHKSIWMEFDWVYFLFLLELSKFYPLKQTVETPSLVLRCYYDIFIQWLEGDICNTSSVIFYSIAFLVRLISIIQRPETGGSICTT